MKNKKQKKSCFSAIAVKSSHNGHVHKPEPMPRNGVASAEKGKSPSRCHGAQNERERGGIPNCCGRDLVEVDEISERGQRELVDSTATTFSCACSDE